MDDWNFVGREEFQIFYGRLLPQYQTRQQLADLITMAMHLIIDPQKGFNDVAKYVIERERNNCTGRSHANEEMRTWFQAHRNDTLRRVRQLAGAKGDNIVADEEIYGHDGEKTREYVSTLHLKLLWRECALNGLWILKGVTAIYDSTPLSACIMRVSSEM